MGSEVGTGPRGTEQTRTTRRRGRRALVVTVLAGVAVPATAGAVLAFNPQPEPPAEWAMRIVGLTHEQFVQQSAVNLADRGTCEVEWSWLAEDGSPLARERAVIPPGEVAASRYHPPEPVSPPPDGAAPERVQVRPAVTPMSAPCDLGITLEVVDEATGRTTVALAVPDRAGR